jgi:hypothetical protein
VSHTHGNHTIVCDLPTKKLCNERYSRWKLDRKVEYEAVQAERRAVHAALGEAAYKRFIALGSVRIAAILEG